MLDKIELRKCTVCHKSFRWNVNTRCICNECKMQNASGVSHEVVTKKLFIPIIHKLDLFMVCSTKKNITLNVYCLQEMKG